MKTITLWSVPVERALKIVEIMKEEAREALNNNEFEKAENLIYDIRRLQESIEESRADES